MARVLRARDSDDQRVVDLWARLGGVDLAEHPLELAVDADGIPVPVEPRVDRAADRWAGTRFQSAAEGAARRHGSRRHAPGARARAVSAAWSDRRTPTLPPVAPAPDGSEPAVHGVSLDGDRLVVQLDRPADGLRLRGPATDVAGEPQRDGTVAFDTRRDLYGRSVWLATAVYHLDRPGGLGAAAAWRSSLPVETVGDRHRLRVLPGRDGVGELHLGPPRGRRRAGRLRPGAAPSGVRRRRAATDPDLWYFESFAGRSATDTPLAVFAELRRRDPDAKVAWGILDHGHWAPPDARRGRDRLARWYDVLGTARVLVTNTELEEWYRRRPDQLVVQCFHGYPSKAMGESQWPARRPAAAPGGDRCGAAASRPGTSSRRRPRR